MNGSINLKAYFVFNGNVSGPVNFGIWLDHNLGQTLNTNVIDILTKQSFTAEERKSIWCYQYKKKKILNREESALEQGLLEGDVIIFSNFKDINAVLLLLHYYEKCHFLKKKNEELATKLDQLSQQDPKEQRDSKLSLKELAKKIQDGK